MRPTSRKHRVRERIYERDGYECIDCGERALHELTIDHIVPIARGGTSCIENLCTRCKRCNNLKGNTMPDTDEAQAILARILARKAARG